MIYFIALLSGIVTALPQIMPSVSWIAWVSVAPFIYALYKYGAKYRHGLVFGIGYYGLLYHWIFFMYPMESFGMNGIQSVLVIAIAWIALTAMQSAELAAVALAFKYIGRNNRFIACLSLVVSWCLIEWIQTIGWIGVPWGRIALTQTDSIFMIQSASVFGSYGVSFIVLTVNALIALSAFYAQKNKKNAAAFGALAVFLCNLIFGMVSIVLQHDKGEAVAVYAVQGNISAWEKWDMNSLDKNVGRYIDLSYECADGEDGIILWPESVVNVTLMKNPSVAQRISDLAADTGCVVVVGTFDDEGDYGYSDYKLYNALIAFYPDGSISYENYYKRRPVPFGEFLPMKDLINAILPLFTEMNLADSDISPGTQATVFDTEYGRAGSLICFDSIYETLTRDSVKNGAELILLSTNDSWYKNSGALYHHNSHAQLRAVESGRYIVRAASTGITSVISPSGEIIDRVDTGTEGVLKSEIYKRNNVTPYVATGNAVIVFFWILIFAGAALRLIENFLLSGNKSKMTSKKQ